MNDLARLVEGLALYRDKITVAIDAVSALLPAPPEPAPVKRLLPKATNGKRKVKRVKVKVAKATKNGKPRRLSEEQRREILRACATEKVSVIAKRYGVTDQTIYYIRRQAEKHSSPSAPPQPRVAEKPAPGPALRCSYCGRTGTNPKVCDHCRNARF